MLARQKLDALKTAATDFLTDMDNNASPASMVGLVPFSTYVKLPTSYKDETWLEAPANWEGCMNSRRDGFHKTPDFENRRLQGFTQDSECGEALNSEVMPLTSDIDAVKASVQDMFPKGATYIPAGLIWGWRMLFLLSYIIVVQLIYLKTAHRVLRTFIGLITTVHCSTYFRK